MFTWFCGCFLSFICLDVYGDKLFDCLGARLLCHVLISLLTLGFCLISLALLVGGLRVSEVWLLACILGYYSLFILIFKFITLDCLHWGFWWFLVLRVRWA